LLAGTASGAATAAGGVHSNEEFCKIIMVKQVELFGLMTKLDPMNPDMTKRGKYFSDAKELNAKLVKTAPASLASDVALQTTNANAAYDAQASRNATNIKATAAVLSSPANLAAAKRMTDYCRT
jgi:hypothetical protein